MNYPAVGSLQQELEQSIAALMPDGCRVEAIEEIYKGRQVNIISETPLQFDDETAGKFAELKVAILDKLAPYPGRLILRVSPVEGHDGYLVAE